MLYATTRRLGYGDSPNADVVQRLTGFINERYRQILTHTTLARLREIQGATVTTVAGTATVTLAPLSPIARVLRVYDAANRILLEPRSLLWYRALAPDPSMESGTPVAWVMVTEQTTGVAPLTLAFWPTPSAAVTYTYDYQAALTDLALTGDIPLLPIDFHDVLVLGARMDEYEAREQLERWAVAAKQYSDRLKQLRAWVHQESTVAPLGGRPAPSRLGAWYPAGT